ncbi:Brefeldin A-inhibited guanine nucleotide-exchange protein 3 [Hibiscus syriacus]|uniref:Brefeldin A-inhibited guanine nucleotide-exchange protein 3 n=1 Tax=Hibiscus syriacus TaxID=106335 RepID=A0A6A3AFN9_HIBSY|nr:Brefeldin A-inhibited guanine nucleotide-exchange protein 3 [Hibiscus syriacus]
MQISSQETHSPSKTPLSPSDSEPENLIPGLINDGGHKLIAHGYLRGEADPTGGPEAKLLAQLIDSVCRCHVLGDDAIELFENAFNRVNQTTVKATLIQMLVVVFRRMEADSSTVPVQPIVVAELMGPVEKSDVDGSTTNFVQSVHDGAFDTTTVETTNPADFLDSTDKDMLDAKYWEISMYKTALEGRKGELVDDETERDDDLEVQIGKDGKVIKGSRRIEAQIAEREDFGSGVVEDFLENAGAAFRTSERFLGAIKQYLCLSLLKNSASTLMIVFQLSCSIFISLVSRVVNGLLKTIQGVPPGTETTLLPPQKETMKLEAIKCLVAILKSMGDWINIQLRIPDSDSTKRFEAAENSLEPGTAPMENGNGDEPVEGSDFHSETLNETSGILTIEQRRAYKLELLEGISLFNRKPERGIEFLIKAKMIRDSSEEIAAFLKNTSGMEFYEAIRAFLQGFRLPGEAQKIDRIMEKFAERYCKCNPKAFISADAAYVLAYSVIMLNTDAHNPMVKNKMLADDFITNNSGIDDGKDLPEEYLRSLFERISRNEIKMKDDNLSVQQKQSVYYAATNVVILRFMVEACWAPLLAAFIVPLDQSDDEVVTALCIEGFRRAIHVTAILSRKILMQSRLVFCFFYGEYFAIVTIADEDGDYLQEVWEHILTCVSRFENLHLLGEGAPLDTTFFAFSQNESEKSKQAKSAVLPVLKKKSSGRIQYAYSAMMRSSYDSVGIGGTTWTITSEKMNNLVCNLNMLEQVGSAEMNRIFARSQKLNNEAIIDFVKALCKVSMEELRSTSDPRVFSLTKIVEITHYNMNRIRLVWSSIWLVLSDFFVTIGCFENLSFAIFAMDSLLKLSMKFLEREELANYNFQNEFMKPFVIAMQKSSAVEIREPQMVLSRVRHVKSGWRIMFVVLTTAAYDKHKNIVLLAFETEKIIRDNFPYITETETTTFTDCVNCLIAFTDNKFIKDVSLNAIAFLRFCAMKLAEGDLGSSMNQDKESGDTSQYSPSKGSNGRQENGEPMDKDDHLYFWLPLLPGDDLLKQGIDGGMSEMDRDAWLYETCTLALQLLVDLFASVYHTVNPLLRKVLSLLLSFIKRPHQSLVGFGIVAFVRLTSSAGDRFLEEQWLEVVSSLKEAVNATLPYFSCFVSGDGILEGSEHASSAQSKEASHGSNTSRDDSENLRMQHLRAFLSDAKCRAVVQLLLVQVAMKIYNMFQTRLSANNILVLFDAMHDAASHVHAINNDTTLCIKLQEFGWMTQMQDPPLLRFENELYQFCLTFLHNLITDRPTSFEKGEVESHLVNLCREVLQFCWEIKRVIFL